MILTFAVILFALLFIFAGLRKNVFFLFYAVAMIFLAYYMEIHLGIRVHYFGKASLMLFVLCHLPLINLFTFIAYGRDKHCAKKGEWRVPEVQLHTLELMGGTIGAIAGQKFFHHKNKKKSYMATFFATIVIQAGIIVFILRYLKII